jgi:hypothetical protein
MTGTRLGVLCEAFALSFIGVIFGIFVSWQLTIIVVVALLVVGISIYLDVSLTVWVIQKSAPVLEHASSVRLDVC